MTEPMARTGWEASSSAATKPEKLPMPPEPPVAARQPAKPMTRATAQAAEDLEQRVEPGAGAGHAEEAVVQAREGGVGAGGLGGFQAVGADGADLGEAFVEQGGGEAQLLLHAARGAAHALAEALDGQDRERVDAGGDEAEHPVEVEHRADEPDDRDGVLERVDGAGEGLADEHGVGGEAGGELGGRLALDLRQVGGGEVGEHAGLELGDGAQDELLDDDVLGVLGGGLGEGDGDDEDGHLVEDALVTADEHGDGAVDHHRVEAGQPGDDEGEQEDGEESGAVAAEVLGPEAVEEAPGSIRR